MRALPSPIVIIIASAAVMLSLGMGVRQSLGLLMQPLTRDIAITVSEFTLAIAVQNLVWGITQPFAGAMVVRHGFRPIMLAGAALYAAGLLMLALAQGRWSVLFGAGALIGTSLSCAASAIAMSVASRVVSPAKRSMTLGVLSAAGSVGALVTAPVAQLLITTYGWRAGALCFFVLALVMIPAAWLAGEVDRMAPPDGRGAIDGNSAFDALRLAAREPSFVLMSCAYFVCGMQLIFITTHLPAYLEICGMDPMLSAKALGVIGGFNVLGSLFFGWAGGRWNKLALLGVIYVLRSLVVSWYILTPPTPASTLVFSALIGFLWLGVGPLVAGAVADLFGLKWQAMLQGIAFMGHQLGSFAGAFGGGILYDSLGSYDLAWRLGVGIGLAAGLMQISFALVRPSERLAEARQG